jgi:hypothetical protein
LKFKNKSSWRELGAGQGWQFLALEEIYFSLTEKKYFLPIKLSSRVVETLMKVMN